MNTSLTRAQAKLVEIERELGKYPDFQLYLIAKSRTDRARMERLLMKIPGFPLWRKLQTFVIIATASSLGPREAEGTS